MTDMREPLLGGNKDANSSSYTISAPGGSSIGGHDPLSLPPNTSNQLGTLNGCYVPCLLNIMGIILFLRFGWAIGQAGVEQLFVMLFVAGLMAVLTVLSLSAIATNGAIKGGGSYYMMSRTLGPESGGSIGLLFYSAYAMGVAFYILGFADEVQSTWFPLCGDADPQPNCWPHDSPRWLITIIGTIALFFVLCISLKGAEFFAKFNVMFFTVQMLAILVGIISFFVPHEFTVTGEDGASFKAKANFPHHFSENVDAKYTDSDQCTKGHCNFQIIFSIVFPMVTGIMEGANLSGDLKDPSYSIPRGTLGAVFTAMCTYSLLIFAMAGAFARDNLQNDLSIFQDATLGSKYIVVTGIMISAASSALGSLFGGSRVLQALARDDMFKILKPFKYGSKHGDEPRTAVLFTWFVAQCCLCIGNLDVVAPIITSFFCLSYALCNFTCFILTISGAPNFRPRFRYYSWPTSLLGFILNLGIMFFLDWMYAAISIVILTMVFIYLVWFGPDTDWGDITQALMFHQVRKYLLRLQIQQNVKFWRPNLLMLTDRADLGLLGFCNSVKKGGLLVIGQVIVGEMSHKFSIANDMRSSWLDYCQKHRVKAFAQVTVAPTARLGYQFLIMCGGLGGMNFNTVVVPLYHPRGDDADDAVLTDGDDNAYYDQVAVPLQAEEAESDYKAAIKSSKEFCEIQQDVITLQNNLLVTANFGAGIRGHKGRLYMDRGDKRNIDVWLFGSLCSSQSSESAGVLLSHMAYFATHGVLPATIEFTGNFALLLQLGQILYLSRVGPGGRRQGLRNHALRIFHVISEEGKEGGTTLEEVEKTKQYLIEIARIARLDVLPDDVTVFSADLVCTNVPEYREFSNAANGASPLVPVESLEFRQQYIIYNKLMSNQANDSCLVLASLPSGPAKLDDESASSYVEDLETLTKGLPPTALVHAGENTEFISTQL